MFRRRNQHWRDAGLVVPAEFTDQVGDGGTVLLGEFTEAEVLAVGALASIDVTDDEDTRTPLDRVGEREREREVVTAHASLVRRGAVTGPVRKPEHVQGALGLLQPAFVAFHFLTAAFWLDPAASGPAPQVARLVDVSATDGRSPLLEQWLDPASGRTRVSLLTPEAAVDRLVARVFTDHAGPPLVGGSRLSVLRLLTLAGTRAARQQVIWMVQRPEGEDRAEVHTMVGPHQTPPGLADRAALHGGITVLFREGLALP